jgi:hypothetical protein
MSVIRDVTGPINGYNNYLGGGPGRASGYGDAYGLNISSKEWVVADEGSYFVARTATPGTGIIGHAAPTTFDETKPYLLLYNGGQKRIYPQYLRLHETVASAGGARVQFTMVVDQGNRYASAGSALTVVNPNMDSTAASQCTGYVGAVIASAASASRRIVDHLVFRGTIDIVEDVYEIVFGAGDGSGMGGSRAATVQDMARLAPPIVIGPGQSFLIHQWAAAQSTGPTFQVSLGYIER